jgi:hypothetical protein
MRFCNGMVMGRDNPGNSLVHEMPFLFSVRYCRLNAQCSHSAGSHNVNDFCIGWQTQRIKGSQPLFEIGVCDRKFRKCG